MPLAALKMNLLGEWTSAPAPAPAPAVTYAGGIQPRIHPLVITVEGQVLLDEKSVLVGLNGQTFINLHGIYLSPEGLVMLNLNRNRRVFMVIN